jgi:hypothetical protein
MLGILAAQLRYVVNHAEPPRISRDLLVLALGLQTSGNRAWRARQVDPSQAANDGEGLADNEPGWPGAVPQL